MSHRFGQWLAVLALMAVAGSALGGDKTSFHVHSAQGESLVGTLRSIGPDWSMALSATKDVEIPGKDFVSLRAALAPSPAPPLGPQLVLVGGDRIPIDIAKGIQLLGDQIRVQPLPPVQPVQGDELSVPTAAMLGLWFQAPEGVSRPEVFWRKFYQTPHEADVLLLKDGDRLEGVFVSLDQKNGCTIQVQKKKVQVALKQVAALALSDLFASKSPIKPFGHLILSGGCRLSLVSPKLEAGKKHLTGKTLFQAAVQVPVAKVIELDLYQGRAVYLSDLKPKKYTHTPFFGVTWPLGLDSNLSGDALRLGTDFYDKGLSLHSGSEVTYALAGKYEWFEALVGLDTRGAEKGSARLKIFVDGKEQDLGGKAELTGTMSRWELRLQVGQAQTLTLKVDYGRLGDVQGHLNLASARLILK